MRGEGFAEVRAAALKTLIIWSRFNPDKGSRDSVRYLRKNMRYGSGDTLGDKV